MTDLNQVEVKKEKKGSPLERRRFLHPVGKLVNARVTKLQEGYLAGTSTARRDLAALRRAVGREPGEMPEVWALTDVPGPTRQEDPTADEWAVHIALCLYGLHQQGRSQPAHEPGRPFAQAVRSLTGDQAENSPVWRRFTAALLADDIEAMREHLLGIVGQMRSAKAYTPFDYAGLADDLDRIQHPEAVPAVRLRWQRDFYSDQPKKTETRIDEAGD